jgi:hypothetical protein
MTKGEKSGLLSMDNNGRIILEGKNTNFPVIGVWMRSSSVLAMEEHIWRYLISKTNNKCRFHLDKKNFIYLVVIEQKKSIPELFIVEYNIKPKIIKT